MNMRIETGLRRDEAIGRLRAAINRPGPIPMAEAIKPYLDGEVAGEQIVLYRRHGLFARYGRFKGRLEDDGGHTVSLVGTFTRSPNVLARLWAGFAFFWAAIIVVASVARWEGATSIGWLLAATVAVVAGVFALRIRGKNVNAQADLLHDDIRGVFRRHGA